MNAYAIVDIEADGPIPGDYSMLQLGCAIVIDGEIVEAAKWDLPPISDRFVQSGLDATGIDRDAHKTLPPPGEVMLQFETWLRESTRGIARPWFVSDNAIFDGMFVFWYFHHFLGRNPFGWSGHGVTSLYKGMSRNMKANFRGLRKTKHTHDALDDAIGNAEAWITMAKELNNVW